MPVSTEELIAKYKVLHEEWLDQAIDLSMCMPPRPQDRGYTRKRKAAGRRMWQAGRRAERVAYQILERLPNWDPDAR